MNKEIPQNRRGQIGWSALMGLLAAFALIIATQTCCGMFKAGPIEPVNFYKSLLAESNEKYALQYASSVDVLNSKDDTTCGGTVIQREIGKPIVVVSAAHCFHPIRGKSFKVGDVEIFIMEDPTEAKIRQCLGTDENRCFGWDMKIAKLDRDLDLAVLVGSAPEKFSGPFVNIASSGPRIGDPIVMIGAPNGRSRNVSLGVISFINLETHTGDVLHYYTDAAVFPGNSGGGMFNSNGELIGVAHTAMMPLYPIVIHGHAACIALPHIQKLVKSVFEGKK